VTEKRIFEIADDVGNEFGKSCAESMMSMPSAPPATAISIYTKNGIKLLYDNFAPEAYWHKMECSFRAAFDRGFKTEMSGKRS
jgi:hypothetical protein